MRRYLLAALTAAMLLGTALPAAAHPSAGPEPTLPTDLTHWKTDNVEYLGRFPEHTGTAGGQLVGTTYFVTDPRGVYAYDVTKPESPVLLDSLTLYQHRSGTGAALAQEDPDTDGNILIVDGSATVDGNNAFTVVDVSDPSDLKIASSVPGTTDHTWECVSATDPVTGEVNGCAYAYGRTGHIMDLRDPTAAKKTSRSWRNAVKYTAYTHDLNEIRPGLVMSAGAQAVLMDTRDPSLPVKLATLDSGRTWSGLGYHSVEWANGGTDPFVVAGTEITPSPNVSGAGAGSDCEGTESVIETWDATEILAGLEAYSAGELTAEEAFADKAFKKTDSFDAGGRGIFVTGNAPANVLYCAHWFEPGPQFNGSGLVAVAYYDRGTRFVNVDAAGKMTEVGWMVPAEGYAGSVQWVTDEIVYVQDYRRGLEILRLKPTPAEGVESEAPTAIAVGSSYVPPSALNVDQLTNIALGGFGLIIGAGKLRARRQRRAQRADAQFAN